MLFQDWVLPVILAVILLDFGIVWSARLKRENQWPVISSDVSKPLASRSLPTWLSEPVRVLILIGGVVFLVAMLSYAHTKPVARWFVLSLMAVGLMLSFLGGCAIWVERFKEFFRQALQNLAARLNVSAFQPVLLVGALLFAMLAAVSTVYSFTAASQRVAAFCWGAGIVLAVLGGWNHDRVARPSSSSVFWFFGLTALALLLRATSTHHVPAALTGDEGDFGEAAFQFLLGRANNLFATGVHGFPTLYLFIQSLFIGLLGTTSQALRLPSAFVGALTVGGVYLMGKQMFGQRVGLFAGIFLAFFHFYIHFGRLGLNNVWDGMWYVVVLGAFWQGWQAQKRSAFLLAGVGLGLAQYFYASARVLPLILLAWLGLLAFADQARFRRNWPDLGLLFFIAFIAVLPLAVFYIFRPDDFIAPLQAVKIAGPWLEKTREITHQPTWKIILNQLKVGFLAYTHVPVVFFYEPGTPILRPVSAVFFGVGLAALLGRFCQPQTWLFLLWPGTIALLGAFSTPTPAAQRYIAAAPAYTLLVAFGFVQILEWFKRLQPRFTGVASLIFISVDDAVFYFLDFIPRNQIQWKVSLRNQHLAEHLQIIPGEWRLICLEDEPSNYCTSPVTKYLLPGVEMLDFPSLMEVPAGPRFVQDHLIFVFLPGYEEDLVKAQTMYPSGEILAPLGPEGKPMYWLYDYAP